MKHERTQEELANNVRMLDNSLDKLNQQEKLMHGNISEHPDQRIPKYKELIKELESKLPERV